MRWTMLVLLLLGCGDDDEVVGLPGGVSTLDAGSCHLPLAEFCDGACPSFDESVAEVARLAQSLRCYIAESGTCGALRYTYHSTGFGGFQAWFDATGALVAARRFSDVPEYCGNDSYDVELGLQPVCERRRTAEYCP